MLVIAGYSRHRNQISYKFNGSVKIGRDVKSTIKDKVNPNFDWKNNIQHFLGRVLFTTKKVK